MATKHFIRNAVGALSLVCVAGCAQLPDWAFFGPLSDTSNQSVAAGHYNFDWRLSGDRRVGAQQVFDDGKSTWLQFADGQSIPAIFARTAQGDRVLTPRRHAEYAVVEGVWPILILRSGTLESRAERFLSDLTNADAAPPSMGVAENQTVELTLVGEDDSLADVNDPIPVDESVPLPEANVHRPGSVPERFDTAVRTSVLPSDGASTVTFAVGAWPISGAAITKVFGVTPEDGNLRLALVRWAQTSGWTFEAEHWAVDVDIPIVGSASFESEFSAAVQELLASTELSERPLQPCFYANRVLRVVPYAQSCDRSVIRERA